MNSYIFFALLQNGLTNGAIYTLVALALVMVFTVTRVIFVQAGEFISFGALSLATLQRGHTPLSLWIMVVACSCVAALEFAALFRRRAGWNQFIRPFALWCGLPLFIVIAVLVVSPAKWPLPVQVALALAIVTPLGPAMYRLGYRAVAEASILILLIISIAIHFVMDGLALITFGPEGARTTAFSDLQFQLGSLTVSAQSLVVVAASIVLVGTLFWFSRRTMYGCALRAAANNRRGAALMGISGDLAGYISFTIGAFICAAAGVLIAPFVTVYYDSGFLITLKAFVGAVVGAMVSYPLAAVGAIIIGVFESFAAFWSSAYKDVIVFALMIPILLWCSLLAHRMLDEEEDSVPIAVRRLPKPAAQVLALLQRVPRLIYLAVAVALLALVPLELSRFYVTLLSYVCLYTIVAFGVVLLTGIAGQVSFGQAAFVGIAAYCSALLTTSCWVSGLLNHWFGSNAAVLLAGQTCGLSPWVSLPFSLLLTGVCAWVLGWITLRMRGHYLPIATISWAVAIFFFFGNTNLLGGSTGMTDLPGIPLFANLGALLHGAWLPYGTQVYYLILLVTILCGIVTQNLLDSRMGRAIRALKSREIMAESVGVNTGVLKVKVFLFAALFAGISGWLYAHMQRFVNPSPFGLTMGAEYLFMVVVGGANYVMGAVLGAATLQILSNELQNLQSAGLFGRSGNFEMIVLGLLIVVMMQRTRGGLAAVFARFARPRDSNLEMKGKAPVKRTEQPERGRVLLEVKAVTKRFAGLTAVDQVSFDVRAGEIVALIGPNGAGKSTMFNLITGVLPATAGEIHFRNKRIDHLGCSEIANVGVARTFQHVKLLSDRTSLENVAIGAFRLGKAGFLRTMLRMDRSEEGFLLREAARQLRRVGLGASLDTPSGALPLGKQRILEIARALAAEPVILLLDEPAAGLRFGEKQELATLLRELRAEGMSILLVEHDMAFVMGLVDRIVVMNFGRKLADGIPAAIQGDPLVRSAYLGGAP